MTDTFTHSPSRVGILARRVAAVIALAASASVSIAQGPPPAGVRVDAARQEVLPVPRSVTGEIITLRRSLLASQVEGLIIELELNPGDAVKKGDVIARLDDELARLDVTQAEADLAVEQALVEQREAELERYRNDLDRTEKLSARGGTTASELDAARVDVRVTEALAMQARAQVKAHEAELARARKNLNDHTIRAPFDGRVVLKQAEVGEWVTPGDTVLEMLSLTQLEARISVPEHLVSNLGSDADLGTITVSVPGLGARGSVEARLIGVIPDGDSLGRMFTARLSVLDPTGGLKPGMSITAFIPTGSSEPVLTISKDAILRDDAGEFVYLSMPHSVEGNPAITGQAVPARITRLFAAGDRVAIRPGQIRPGSLLLVEGNERVFPTQPLIVQESPAGDTPAPSGGSAGAEGNPGSSREASATGGEG